MKLYKRLCSLMMSLTVAFAAVQFSVAVHASAPFAENNIPGNICAADFDYGAQNETWSGYKTKTREGTYDDYRKDGSTMNIYRGDAYAPAYLGFNRNEWVVYTVNVTETGTYNMVLTYATPNAGGALTINFDDGAFVGAYTLAPTDSWSTTVEDEIGAVTLTKGTHKMLITETGTGLSFRRISFEKPTETGSSYAKQTGSYRATTLPAIIQAEDFDLGVGGTVSLDNKNDLRKYRLNANLDIGGKDSEPTYVHLNSGEAANYTVNCEYGAVYSLDVSTSSAGNLSIYIDGSKYPYNVDTKASGDYTLNHIGNIYIPAGEHVITMAANDVFYIDYLSVLKTDAEGINISDLNARSYPIVEEETEVINDVYAELYVSPNGDDSGDGSAAAPFATIQRAVDEVPKLRGGMTGDIVINIAGGDYKIAEPISLTEENGGRDGYNVIFRGDAGNKPVINGGTQVSGWTKYDEKVWSAPLDVKEDIRQLYINDVEATRARSKYRYFAAENYTIENSVVSQGIKVNSRNFPCRFEHPEDMELVWDLEWKCNYTGVSEILYDTDNGETNTIVMDQPSWGKFANNAEDAKNVGWGARFYFSNAKELLDEPGEFYYDKHEKVIYYYPYSYEDLTNAACYVGTTELMLQACGANLENKLDGLRMENLQFKYGAWNEPSEIGVVVRQGTTVKDPKATGLDWYEMPGQLDFKYCKNIKITNCNFNCLGSTAITMNEDVTYAQISGNIFTDISGGGVSIDEQSHNNNLDLTKYGRSTDITISNNIFRRIGTDYRSSCAIMGYYTKNFKILHNDIRDIPYTGISAGWGWQDNMLTGIMTDIEIAYNYIEDTNTPTHDGAQIYTLAEQANTSIHDNYLQKSGDHRGGIYLDEGSTNMKVYNNVVKDAYYWLCARPNVSIKNVVATNNYSDTSTMWIDTAHVELTDTTVVTDGNWPDEALYIMENSGLEAEYRHLYDETPDFPENRTQIKDIPIYEYVTTDQTYVRAVDFLPGWGVGYYRSVGRGTEASRISYREAKIRDQEILNDIWINTSNWHDFSIGDVEEDDFWCYTYHCKQEGDYDFWMEYKNGFPLSQPHAKVTVLVDGVEVISRALLESTGDGDWSQPPVTTSFGKVHLTEGSHHVKIMTVDNGWSFLGWGFSDGDMKVPFGNDIEYDELGYVDEKQPEKIVEFTDIAGHWAENDIRAMQKAGIINGMTDTLFAPNTPLTLYQTAWLALRSLGIPYTEETWKALAVQNGLLTDENELDAPITRERLAYNIMNAYTNIVGSYSITVGAALYTDMDEISPAYEQAVRGANSQGLLKGDLSGTFRPKSELTRAEGAAAFHRLYSLFH